MSDEERIDLSEKINLLAPDMAPLSTLNPGPSWGPPRKPPSRVERFRWRWRSRTDGARTRLARKIAPWLHEDPW